MKENTAAPLLRRQALPSARPSSHLNIELHRKLLSGVKGQPRVCIGKYPRCLQVDTAQTIVAFSANLPKQPPKCRLDVLCIPFLLGLCLKSSMWNKWKNHFSVMKGECKDVTSWKRRGTRRCLYIPRQEIIDNPIPTSLFFNKITCTHSQVFRFILKLHPSTHKQQNSCIAHKRCRDGVINDFLSRYRHLLVPLLFHDVTSLHTPSFQRNDFCTCIHTCHVYS